MVLLNFYLLASIWTFVDYLNNLNMGDGTSTILFIFLKYQNNIVVMHNTLNIIFFKKTMMRSLMTNTLTPS